MLNFGNKEFRNLQEQVEKNMNDIALGWSGGIKISYYASTGQEFLDLINESNVGKFVLKLDGSVEHIDRKSLYVITRENNEVVAVNLGEFPAVVLGPQGEKGETGETGEDGHSIYGTSENLPSATAYKEGDMYLLNNGEVYKKVNNRWLLQTSIKGPQGLIGPIGTNVVANPVGEPQDDLTTIEIDGVIYEIQPPLSPETLAEVLEGSETVIVDENLEGDKLQVRLDQDVVNKLDRALVTPIVTPTEKVLVGVDTGNSQIQVKIGSGLEFQGITSPYTLVATGGGGNYAVLDDENTFTGNTNKFVDSSVVLEGSSVLAIYNVQDPGESDTYKAVVFGPTSLTTYDVDESVPTVTEIKYEDIANGLFNVINASDITGNTLTQAQYDLITNGKPTRIIGDFLGSRNPVLFTPVTPDSSNENRGLFVGSYGNYNIAIVNYYKIIKSSKAISLLNTVGNSNIKIDNGSMVLNSCSNINGKNIPAYPSNTGTFVLKCVDGTLTWVAE